jgi:hypothetical protein
MEEQNPGAPSTCIRTVVLYFLNFLSVSLCGPNSLALTPATGVFT